MGFYSLNIFDSFTEKMSKFYFLLCFSLSSYLMSQTNDNLIVGKKQNLYYTYINETIVITNDESDTYFSGVINFSTNNGGVRIKPITGYKIIIKPIDKDHGNTLLDGDGTVVGSRRPGSNNKPPEKSLSVEISPIPTNQYINILSDIEICKYEIYELNGFLKYQKTFNCIKNSQLDVSFLSKGNYILVLETKNTNRITKYFIKN